MSPSSDAVRAATGGPDFAERLFSVKGRIALITGGTSGVGAMSPHGRASAGAITYLISREPPLSRRPESNVHHIAGDLAGLEGVAAVAAEFLKHSARLDILVNAAGTHTEAPLDEFSESDWDTIMGLNFKSVFFLTQKLLPALRKAASREC